MRHSLYTIKHLFCVQFDTVASQIVKMQNIHNPSKVPSQSQMPATSDVLSYQPRLGSSFPEVSHKWGPLGRYSDASDFHSVVWCVGGYSSTFIRSVIHCVYVKQFAFTSTYSWTFGTDICAFVNKPAVSVHGQLYVDVFVLISLR